MFSLYSIEKGAIFFPYKYDVTLFSKKQRWFSFEIITKRKWFWYIGKDVIHSRKDGIFSDRKIKRDKVYSVK